MFNKINETSVSDTEILLFDKLKVHLNKHSLELWETYASNEAVFEITMKMSSIMLDDHEAKDLRSAFDKHVQKEDTIVCMDNEYTLLRDLENVTYGSVRINLMFCCHESYLVDALDALNTPKYLSNCVNFKRKTELSKNKLIISLDKRHFYIRYESFIVERVIGNSVEQKLWVLLHERMKQVYKRILN